MLNKHQIIGRVGKEPETRTFEGGNKVTSFSVATSEKYRNKAGETVEEIEWHNVVIWGKLAEIVEKYVKKGDLLYLCGKSKTRSWEKDGITRYTTELVADEMKMLGGKTSSNNENSDQKDDLPF